MKPLLLAAAAASALIAAPASAQDDRRLSNLERQVRELRSIVFQARDTGQPVVVRMDPDPAVVALQGRVDTLEESIRRQNGQLEVLSHDIDQVRQAVAAARDSSAELRGQLQGVSERLARIEGQLQALAAAPPPAAAAGPPAPLAPDAGGARIPPPPPAAAEASALPTRAPPGPVPPPPAAPAGQGESFRRARQLMNAGDYAAAADAWQDYLARFASAARAAEARYFLGETQFAREAYADAARAYAEALKGWPTTAWAPDALVKLAQALQHLNRRDSTCSALSAFDVHYGGSATAEVRERAAATREVARCPAAATEAAPSGPSTPARRPPPRTTRPRPG